MHVLNKKAKVKVRYNEQLSKSLNGFVQIQKRVNQKAKRVWLVLKNLNNQDHQKRNETNELYIPPGPRLGDQVLDVNNLTKSFGDRVLIDDLSFSVPKGAIVGIIGPNGAGKSTLYSK